MEIGSYQTQASRSDPNITDQPLYLLVRPIQGFQFWGFPQRVSCNHSLSHSAYLETTENVRVRVKITSDFPQSFCTFR